MTTPGEPMADGVAPHLVETVVPGSTLVEDACETICALFLVVSIVLIAAEAIARNVFATSFQITDEVCGYLLVALTFLSMSVAEAHGAFHRVELVQARLSFAARLISQMVFDFVSLVASALSPGSCTGSPPTHGAPKTSRRRRCKRRCGFRKAPWRSGCCCCALP